ncbi:MAG: L-fucose/L-arabinose isomerase family protein [Anaerolineales bacterium]|nr:L-fucose/L-arabinose isomerase family protein [Anaerolineales bacterium]
MPNTPSRIAFAALARPTFDVPLAQQVTQQACDQLQQAGFELLTADSLIADLAGVQAYLSKLDGLEYAGIDLLIIFQATFADSTMVVEIAQAVDAPILLWAVPETWTGERLRLNSLCGINLAGHALTLRKIQFEYVYGSPQDTEIIDKIQYLAPAGALRRKLKTARLGVVGEHPVGMDTCHLDETRLRDLFGIQIQRIELVEVFDRARSIPNVTISKTRSVLDARLQNLTSLDQIPLNGTLSVYTALKDIAAEHKLDGLAVRCWPEFFTELGCAACGAMSMLSDGFGQSTPLPCSCEADINGTLTQLVLQILADAPAFGTDIVGIDQAEDLIALWHCGLAPLSMADQNTPARGGVHSNRGVPLVMEFALRPGEITFARISQAAGDLRFVIGKGEFLALPKPFSGTSGTLRPDIPAKRFLDSLMREGLEHHISIVYGDHMNSLVAFANLAGIPILNLSEEVKQ